MERRSRVHRILYLWEMAVRVFRSYDLLGRRQSERHADFMKLATPVVWRAIESVQCLDSHQWYTHQLT